ncbi:MAG: FmdB family zinc ribbon protein [Thermodesulfobacteriota bacterium]
MPTYKCVCIECEERMEVLASIGEKEKGLKLTYPKCGSKRMAQVFRSFAVRGSSRGGNSPQFCGSNCRPWMLWLNGKKKGNLLHFFNKN